MPLRILTVGARVRVLPERDESGRAYKDPCKLIGMVGTVTKIYSSKFERDDPTVEVELPVGDRELSMSRLAVVPVDVPKSKYVLEQES